MQYVYNPYDDPYSTMMYATYTASSPTVPTYSLQQTLLSLSDQQSRIHAQREALAAEERRLRHLRSATLKRLRAQRYREVLQEPDLENIIESVLARNRGQDEAMRESVMYASPQRRECGCADDGVRRTILSTANAKKMERGLPSSAMEFEREIRVREMLDPTPKSQSAQFQFYVHPQQHVHHGPQHHQYPHQHQFQGQQQQQQQFQGLKSPDLDYADTPVVDELSGQQFQTFGQSGFGYVPETPSLPNKRGSRRDSTIRRDSQSPPFTAEDTTTSIDVTQTLQSFAVIRSKLQSELATIPTSIRIGMTPTPEDQKALHYHITRLEDLLDQVDSISLPSADPDDLATTRRARREVVTEIVAAIDGIEQHVQPSTPKAGSVLDQGSDSEGENELIDMEIQRVIRETLARKKDEESSGLSYTGSGRRSVTVEDAYDEEY